MPEIQLPTKAVQDEILLQVSKGDLGFKASAVKKKFDGISGWDSLTNISVSNEGVMMINPVQNGQITQSIWDTTSTLYDNYQYGQSFTAVNDQYLIEVGFDMMKRGTGTPNANLYIDIYEANASGLPGVLLHTEIRPPSIIKDFPTYRNRRRFKLSNPIKMINGKKYVIMVRYPGIVTNGFDIFNSNTDTYAGGNKIDSSDSVNFNPAITRDLTFEVNYGLPADNMSGVAETTIDSITNVILWDTIDFQTNVGVGSSITFDILDEYDNILRSNISNGEDTSDINTDAYKNIKLKISITKTTDTAEIYDLGVYHYESAVLGTNFNNRTFFNTLTVDTPYTYTRLDMSGKGMVHSIFNSASNENLSVSVQVDGGALMRFVISPLYTIPLMVGFNDNIKITANGSAGTLLQVFYSLE